MRLSNRGWNNVLIFATLFMIILFNSTHQKFVEGDSDTEYLPLVPAQAIIQVIDYSGIKLERIGSNWRVQSAIEPLPEVDADALVTNWQSVTFQTLASRPELSVSAYSLPVLVQALGLDSQLIFLIHVEPESGLVYVHNKLSDAWWIGSSEQLPQLVPSTLLKESK